LKRVLLLLFLPLLACGILTTPPPPTLQPATVTVTLPPHPTDTLTPPTATPIPPTDTPTSTTTFPDPAAYTWQEVVNGLQRPVDIQSSQDGSGRLFVIEKVGRIRILQNGQLLDVPFLDITNRVGSRSNEQGLLGLAFHPSYEDNGRFFVNYTDKNGNTVIARYQVSSDPNVADPASETALLRVEQPFPNHNGGVLAFGPNGYLYAGLGDGGSQGDPFGNAQNLNTLLGKILRLDVDQGEPYVIPSDNPFGSEVWALGLRNPWRMSFDRVTGDLYVADVGQNTWEEIDFLPAGSPGGANFGWSYREGAHNYEGNAPAGLIEPVAEYSHAEGGCSVTGGYVYRGSMSEWQGIYLYGDYCSGLIWGLIRSGAGWQNQLLFEAGVTITSFGQDESGGVYFASDSGGIYCLIHK